MQLKFWGCVIACVGLGGAGMALKATDRRHPDLGVDKRDERKVPPAPGQRPVTPTTNQNSTGTRSPPASAPLQANILAADDLNQEWDDLKDVERMEYLESRFGTALAAIELRRSAGRDPFNYAARTGAVEG